MRACSFIPFAALVTLAVRLLPSSDRPSDTSLPDAGAAVLTYRVQATPATGAGPARFADSSGFTARFTVKNIGTSTDTYDLLCYGTNIVCTNQSATVATLSAGDSLIVTVTYSTTHTTGTAWLRLAAESANALGHGSWTFTVWAKVLHAASVTPVSGIAPNPASFTSGYTAAFTVKNVGVVRDSFNLFCQPAANITCTSQTLSTTPGLNAFDSSTVTVTYATGPSGPSFLALEAVSVFASATGSWTFTVLVGSRTAAPVSAHGQGGGGLAHISATRPLTGRDPRPASSTDNIPPSRPGTASRSR